MEYIKLKDICDLKNGYAFKSSDYVEKSDVLNCRMSNIRPNATFDAEYNPKYLPNDYAEKYKEYLLYDGDLIIAMTDLANDPKILGVPTIVYTNGYKMLLNQRVGKLLLLNERPIKKKYLKYALSVPQNRGYFKKFAGGGVQINIGKAEILNIDIPYCDIETQNKIVEILDKAQSLIDKKKEQIKLLDELVKSRFIEMFGDPVSNSKGWENELLGNLGTLGRGISKHRPRNAPELLGGIYPLIQTGDVANSDLYIKKYNSTYSELGLKQSKMWEKGTLCITIAANIAKTSILEFDSCFPDSVVGFISGERTNSIFIHYWFTFFQRILENQAPESAQKNINLKILNNLEVILPPIELQNEFAEFVTQTDSIRSKMETSLSELEDNFNSLMQKAFKGELF